MKNIVVLGMEFIIKIMNKRTKEKRFLDEDDLTWINCTFKDIKRTNESIIEELKNLRDVNDIREKANDIRLSSMEKSNDIRYYTLLAVISFFGILLSIFKVLF